MFFFSQNLPSTIILNTNNGVKRDKPVKESKSINPNGNVPKSSNEIFTKNISENAKTTLNTKEKSSISTTNGNSPGGFVPETSAPASVDNKETYNRNSYDKLQENFK